MIHNLVSVIIPVYNVENYLEECLNSISRQSYEKIEIIAVDDGSTDGSGRLCDEYAKREARLRVIHQGNKGVVSARNKGICQARGEYICFVDADDSVDIHMIGHLVKAIGSTDVATCGALYEKKDGSVALLEDAFREMSYNSVEEIEYVLKNMIRFKGCHREGILPYVWGKLYKTEYITDLPDELNPYITYGEDRELVYRFLLKAKSITITHEPLYFYRYRKDSALHAANRHALHDINYLYEALYEAFSSNLKSDILLPQLEMLIAARICMAPGFMGFSARFEAIRYLFPYYNFFHGEKVVLYGAGRIGWNYYYQTRHLEDIDYVLWVDKNYRSDEVCAVENILRTEYDYVLIAVLDEGMAEAIKGELVGMGISGEKLLWRKPVVLYDE